MLKARKWWNERGYTTQKELKETIQKIINSKEDNHVINDEKNKELLIWVLSHHHEYEEKINYCEKFELQIRRSIKNPRNKELWIIKNDGTAIDISWIKALSPTGGSTVKDNLRSAAVQIIEPQIFDFKDKNKEFNCCLCSGIIDEKIEACHYEPRLDQLLTNFFGDETAMGQIIINDGAYAYRYFDDTDLKDSWIDFHKKNAILKPAHATCIRKRKRA